MPNQLDGTVKDERSKALIELNDINEHTFTEKFIGRVMDVLIEKEIKDKPDYYEGYTRNYIKVIVHCMSADITGKIVDVEIKELIQYIVVFILNAISPKNIKLRNSPRNFNINY